jgi:hypothetical protein
VFIGPGETDLLDRGAVTYLGPIENERIYAYKYFADAGLVLAQGAVQHNESSKIYEYLRCGLPVVSEAPVPNNAIIRESGLGYVAEFMNDQEMCEMLVDAVNRDWDKSYGVDYMLKNHTWDKRVAVYDRLISEMKATV